MGRRRRAGRSASFAMSAPMVRKLAQVGAKKIFKSLVDREQTGDGKRKRDGFLDRRVTGQVCRMDKGQFGPMLDWEIKLGKFKVGMEFRLYWAAGV